MSGEPVGLGLRVRGGARAIFGTERGDRIVNALRDTTFGVSYRLDSRGRRSAAILGEYKDAYRGERCFIIGNGPSLNAMDLAPLRSEFTFGLNRGYLMFDRIGGATSFLVAANQHVVRQFASEILSTGSRAFLNWHCRHDVQDDDAATYLWVSSGPRFSDDIARNGVWDGGTVTFIAMQLAYHMGFSEVVLIGVDHSFAAEGAPRSLVVSTADDVNHFDPSYFGAGISWQLPDLETSEIAYKLAKDKFEATGRRIVDATVGGKLTVFPKAEYADLTRR